MLRIQFWRVVTALRADRGEGPVPYIIMVALMALAAVAIAGGITAVANGWLGQLPDGP